MLIKNKIQLKNKDVKIRIPLGGSIDFTGKQQEIESQTQFNMFDLVNPVADLEVRRFKYENTTTSISYRFHNQTDDSFSPDLTLAGFSSNELLINTPASNNSFFIMDCYDTFNPYGQIKLFSNYNTQILRDSGNTTYILNNKQQQHYLNIPLSFLDEVDDDNIEIFAKFMMYNAKNGRVFYFYNDDNKSLITNEKYYVKINLNLLTNTWEFLTESVIEDNVLKLNELERNKYVKFNEKLNRSVENTSQEAIIPPEGNYFDDETLTYLMT